MGAAAGTTPWRITQEQLNYKATCVSEKQVSYRMLVKTVKDPEEE
jgi:hypothetical protein